MAGHAFEDCPPSYADGIKVGDRTEFPKTFAFTNAVAPARFQGDIEELEVYGTIPKSIHGTYYSMGVDKCYPPIHEDDIVFNGDGCVGAYYISNGHVDWKRRFVQNDRYKAEHKVRKSLFGKYRNPYTDDASVRDKGIIRTTSNTNIVFWRGVMLACKEDGPPYALDPETLETLGRYDFDGQVLSPTFTAHPKIDPDTGNMLCFGYQAGGDGNDASKEIVFYEIGADGKKLTEVWFESPFCGYMHDFAFTKNHVILPVTPLKADLQRLQKGGNHWAWDPSEDHYFGIAPRRNPKREDIVWLRSDNCFQGHVAGAYEDQGKLYFDLSMADGNVFFWFPEEGKPPVPPAPGTLNCPMTRYAFEVDANGRVSQPEKRVTPALTCKTSVEFARIDDRFQGKLYNHFWSLGMDGTRPYDFARCGPPPGGLFNILVHYNWSTGTEETWWAGPTTTVQEPCFVPLDVDKSPEGEGHIVVVLNHLVEHINELAVFEAQNLSKGPVALIRLPLRPRMAFHGNFVDHRDIEQFEKQKEEFKRKEPAAPLPWQQKLLAKKA